MSPDEASAVVAALRPTALRWAESYVDAQDAEDVAQDALAVLLQRPERVDLGSVDRWLRTTVWRTASTHRRRRREVLVGELPEPAADDNPEVTLRSVELQRVVQAALARLPASRRVPVVEVLGEGRTQADVAAELEEPESAVRRRKDDGAEELRADLHRQRVAERRRTGGFSSWCAMVGIQDVRALARRVTALGAAAAGGALLHMGLGGPVLGPTPDEAPARAVIVEPLVQPSAATAVRGVEVIEVAPARPRARHDAGQRFRADRW